jgi:hypothetical protein
MPSAADDRVAGGGEAGRAGLPAVHPQAPSTRAPITIGAAVRIWPERAAQVPLLTVARVPIKVLVTVILPGQWLTARRRTCRPSRTAALAPTSRGLRC